MRIFVALLFMVFSNVFAGSITLLNSESGGKMLASSITDGYAKQFLAEVKYFTYQQSLSFCGVATAAIVLNTLGVLPKNDNTFGPYKLFTQNNIFNEYSAESSGITESGILQGGLTLSQETKLLNSFNGILAVEYSTESLSMAQTRNIITEALKSDNQLVIANILRSKMDESGGGHISPVVAYDVISDSVLFLDVTSYKSYGPTWVPMQTLYNGMHTKDGNTYRGFILVGKSVSAQPKV